MEEPLNISPPKSKEVPSPEEKKALDEFHAKQKEKTIKIYIGIIVFLIIINITCVAFYIIYALQIKSLDTYISTISNEITDRETILKQSRASSERLIVKLYSDIQTNVKYITDLIQSPEEYNMIMNWLPEKKEPESQQQLSFCFKNVFDGQEPLTFREQCSYDNNLLVIIMTEDYKRFGGFVQFDWSTINDDTFISDKNAFLFSIDDKQKYKVKDEKNAFKFLSKGFFMFGDGDFVVEDSHEGLLRGYSKFPKSYEGNKPIVEGESFKIMEMEIFTYHDYMYMHF